jgi:hypothetical protein
LKPINRAAIGYFDQFARVVFDMNLAAQIPVVASSTWPLIIEADPHIHEGFTKRRQHLAFQPGTIVYSSEVRERHGYSPFRAKEIAQQFDIKSAMGSKSGNFKLAAAIVTSRGTKAKQAEMRSGVTARIALGPKYSMASCKVHRLGRLWGRREMKPSA